MVHPEAVESAHRVEPARRRAPCVLSWPRDSMANPCDEAPGAPRWLFGLSAPEKPAGVAFHRPIASWLITSDAPRGYPDDFRPGC